MTTVQIDALDGGVTRIRLSSGRGNPLTPQAVHDLHEAVVAVQAAPPRALLIDAGDSPIFSGGFALPIVADYGRDTLRAFFGTFVDTLTGIVRLPCPSVCAVAGHAVAGGFILTLAADFRVVRTGPLKLGLPEVDLGVPVPAGPQALLAARTSPQHSLWLSTTGTFIDGEEAHRIGLANQLATDANTAALALAQRLAEKPGAGPSRSVAAAALADHIQAEEARCHEAFLDAWFSDVAQARIQAQADKLGRAR